MYEPKEKKKDNNITINIDLSKVPKGHTPHRSGAGKHKRKKPRNKKVESDE